MPCVSGAERGYFWLSTGQSPAAGDPGRLGIFSWVHRHWGKVNICPWAVHAPSCKGFWESGGFWPRPVLPGSGRLAASGRQHGHAQLHGFLGGDEEEEEDGSREERLPSCFDYVMHFLTVFWKVLFACVPPTEYCHGWACFGVCILVIGLLTALIGDLASHFGCTVGLKDSVNAVVFVALGTSIPDTFASKVAALQDQCADASIGNVTGSNAVNVFLGLGVAWSVAAVYWAVQGRPFEVRTGTLAFSVTLFTVFAFVGIGVLLYRRRPHIGGELGGPRGPKLATAALFLGLWLLYILFASLEAYCHIRGF